ncbi:MAG: hypothetical protein PHP65_03075 [Bacilli bacterium]|jgi:hypothetical protein|nr:hypothetical protein [Bacilli bacterium]
MKKELKYMIITVESYPYGWETNFFYLPMKPNTSIGDVITAKNKKQYRIVDGKTQMNLEDIDTTKYKLFEE